MPTRDLKTLYAEITAALRHLEEFGLSAFRSLNQLDAELHDKVVQTLESEIGAAHWFSDPLDAFKNRTAWEMLLIGDRRVVLEVLARMEYGLYG